jgi:hypothetical protein
MEESTLHHLAFLVRFDLLVMVDASSTLELPAAFHEAFQGRGLSGLQLLTSFTLLLLRGTLLIVHYLLPVMNQFQSFSSNLPLSNPQTLRPSLPNISLQHSCRWETSKASPATTALWQPWGTTRRW